MHERQQNGSHSFQQFIAANAWLKRFRPLDNVIQLGVQIRPMGLFQFFAKFSLSFFPKADCLEDQLVSLGSEVQPSAPVITFWTQHHQTFLLERP